LREQANPKLFSVTTEIGFLSGLMFVIGLLGIGLGYPGQPHVVNRFMAIQDEASMKRGKVIAIVWAIIIYVGMVLLGLCGRVLIQGLPNHEQIFFRVAALLLSPVFAGMMIAAVLSAIMSTVDSQLLVAASSVTHDSSLSMRSLDPSRQLLYSRATVLIITILAVWMAVRVSEAIFSRVLFAWNALGAAFGPLVLVSILGRRVRPGFTLASMLVGFVGTVVLSMLPNAPGDIAERYIPFVSALILAWIGRERFNAKTQ
jgi:sodium/proline symporter